MDAQTAQLTQICERFEPRTFTQTIKLNLLLHKFVVQCEERIYCYSVILLSLIKK